MIGLTGLEIHRDEPFANIPSQIPCLLLARNRLGRAVEKEKPAIHLKGVNRFLPRSSISVRMQPSLRARRAHIEHAQCSEPAATGSYALFQERSGIETTSENIL